MPDMGAIVALADYKNVPLDEVIGRDINKAKDNGRNKTNSEISAPIAKLPKDILQEAMLIGEKLEDLFINQQIKSQNLFC